MLHAARFGRPFRANLEGRYPRPEGLGCAVMAFHGGDPDHPVASPYQVRPGVGLGKKQRGACLVGWVGATVRTSKKQSYSKSL
jgi:hypothetical protein